MATSLAEMLNNYMMYVGDDGIYTYTFEHAQKVDCPVCGNVKKCIRLNENMLLSDLIESLTDETHFLYAVFY